MKISKKTVLLIAVVMLISAVTAVTVLARPMGMGIGRERGHSVPFIKPVLIGHGFALNGDQYHILDVNAIKISNSSRGHSRSQLSYLRFAGQTYALNITGLNNQSLTGDVLTLPLRGTNRTGFIPATVGHISLSISKYEGEILSTGTLTMNGTDYKVLLTSAIRHRGWIIR